MRSLLNRVQRTFFKSTEHVKEMNPTVVFNLNAKDNSFSQSIEIELHENISPLSAENFKLFSQGSQSARGSPLSFKGIDLKLDEQRILLKSDFIRDTIFENQKLLHENYESKSNAQ